MTDFADVFGGPPRRSSLGDLRRSRTDSMDSGSGFGSRPGSGLGEKPAFGETCSPARRRHLKDDFFSDIFSGGESTCSSPRRDSGSRISSPARPVSGGGGSSLLPAQISLALKSVKDQPVFGSPAQHTLSKSDDVSPDTFSFPSSTSVITQDDLKLDGLGLYRQSPLSRPNSQNIDRSQNVGVESSSQEDAAGMERFINSGQFHFSIYRWAGKGVKLVMPSGSKNKYGSMFENLPEIIVEDVDLNFQSENISTPSRTSKTRSKNQDNKLLKDLFTEENYGGKSTLASDLFSDTLDSKFLPRAKTNIPDVILAEEKEEEAISRSPISKQQDEKEKNKKQFEVSSPTASDSSISQEEKKMGSKMKGKVKDFIKLFNQDRLPKRKGTFETPGKRFREKGESKGKLEDQINTSVPKAEHIETIRSNNNEFSDFTVPIDPEFVKEEKTDTYINTDIHMNDNLSAGNESRHFSAPETLDAPMWNVEETNYEDFEGCLVEEITEEQNTNLQTDSLQDKSKLIDAKVRQWSKGKEGNIRSLLSTLQVILWPESGWKQVPLVDIIEGPGVKRAYQKALLCLHPDKLQQKGASANQKYTAEKVFDILQEAWVHYNSISQM